MEKNDGMKKWLEERTANFLSFSIKLEQSVSPCLVSCSLFQAQDIHLSDGDGAEDRPAITKKKRRISWTVLRDADCAVHFIVFHTVYLLHDLHA